MAFVKNLMVYRLNIVNGTPKSYFLTWNDVLWRIFGVNIRSRVKAVHFIEEHKNDETIVTSKVRIWVAETPEPIAMKFCQSGAVYDVITHANFGEDRSRGFGVARGRILRLAPMDTPVCTAFASWQITDDAVTVSSDLGTGQLLLACLSIMQQRKNISGKHFGRQKTPWPWSSAWPVPLEADCISNICR